MENTIYDDDKILMIMCAVNMIIQMENTIDGEEKGLTNRGLNI